MGGWMDGCEFIKLYHLMLRGEFNYLYPYSGTVTRQKDVVFIFLFCFCICQSGEMTNQ